MGSRHGTYVNGQRIFARTQLAHDDEVIVGQTIISSISAGDSPSCPTAAPSTEEDAGGWYVEDEGIISRRIDALQTPFQDESQRRQREQPVSEADAAYQLQTFYQFSQALGLATTLDSLLHTLVEHLQKALPQAHGGAVLLLDRQGSLLLRDHWPAGQLPISMTWAYRACHERAAFLWPADPDHEEHHTLPQSLMGVQATIYAPLIYRQEVIGVIYIQNHESPDAFRQSHLDMLRAIANHAALSIKNQMLQQDLQREAAARSNLLSQFPPGLARRMLKERSRLYLSGEQISPVTILQSDIRGFTALSTAMEPGDTVQMLNEMFSTLTPIIFKYQGTIDKFIGDAILAVFGSPEPDSCQWENAVQAAWEMQQAMQALGRRREARGLLRCDIGIGIHTGAVVHGFIGSPERMDYTVIGDTVNWAARYCDGAAPGEIVISKQVYGYECVFKHFVVAPKSVQTKHEGTMKAYVVMGLKEEMKEEMGEG